MIKMKYLSSLLLLGLIACNQKQTDHFVLRGTIPGATDSTEIILAPNGKYHKKIAEGYIINGKFELRGKADQPVYCRLCMNDQDILDRVESKKQEQRRYMEIGFFVENGELTFQTPHIDSLPKSFWQYDERKEKNYTLQGSDAQNIFYRYQQQTIPSRYRIHSLNNTYREKGNIEDFKTLSSERAKLEESTKNFIRQNQNLAVNLYLVEQLKKEPFSYDQAYLDVLAGLFASYQDTCATLKEFRQYLRDAQAFVQGKALENGKMTTSAGKTVSLLEQLRKDGYTVIDFWASWCGPCRASFPHLREMYRLYGEKIGFISLSVDKDEKEWQKALGEEQLPWPQFLAGKELVKSTGSLYNITSIPTFLLIDPNGKIIFSGHSSGELETELAKL